MDQRSVATLRPGGLFPESDVRQLDPTLKPHSHLIAGAAVVGRNRLERQPTVIVRVASPTLNERLVMRTVHSLMMTVLLLAFDTVQSVNKFRLNPSAQ